MIKKYTNTYRKLDEAAKVKIVQAIANAMYTHGSSVASNYSTGMSIALDPEITATVSADDLGEDGSWAVDLIREITRDATEWQALVYTAIESLYLRVQENLKEMAGDGGSDELQ